MQVYKKQFSLHFVISLQCSLSVLSILRRVTAKMTRESEFTVHGNPSNLNAHRILNIMFCNDCLIL